jgi:hypothetical protein
MEDVQRQLVGQNGVGGPFYDNLLGGTEKNNEIHHHAG